MYKISELEDKWKRYNRSRIIVYLLSVVSVLLVILMFVMSIKGMWSDEDTNTEKTTSKMSKQGHQSNNNAKMNKDEIRIKYKDEEVERATRKSKKINLKITKDKENRIKIAEIKKRFEFAQDPQDSIYLARYYESRGEYAEAEKWALETNRIDNTIEDSWLIFARAKAKQGKKSDALKALDAYYQSTSSKKAGNLIDKIKRGVKY